MILPISSRCTERLRREERECEKASDQLKKRLQIWFSESTPKIRCDNRQRHPITV